MAVLQSQNDYEGILLNLAQTEPYVDNNLIGLIEESQPLRGRKMEYKFYPGDATDRAASQQLQIVKPNEYNVITYGRGMISPQPVTVVLPEMQQGLPTPIQATETVSDPDGQTQNLGVVLGQIHYQNQAFVKGMYAVAEQQPDVLEQMKQVTVNSRLDEEAVQRIGKTIDEVMGAVDRNTSGSSSNKN